MLNTQALNLQDLRHLPREARDTLFLLGVIAWVVLPQVSHLPLWCSLLAATVLVWRGWLALLSRPLPSRWWLLALLVATLSATLFTHKTLLGRDAGVTLIVVLLALKTLEMRARRDAFVIFFLGFFTMLTNFFFSQSLLTAAAMLIALLGLLTALVNAHMPVGRPPLSQAARLAIRMAVLGAPVMVALFVLFPRVAPLWGIPGDGATGRTGLSSSMQVGTIATLAQDESIALRLKFDGPVPRQSELYYRGPVLSLFDGREWKPMSSAFPARSPLPVNLKVSGEPVRYEVTLEPSGRPWLFVLDAAEQAPQLQDVATRMTPDLQWLADQPVNDAMRYRAQSHLSFSHGPQKMSPSLIEYVQLPPGFNPRTLQLALDIRRDPQLANADALTLSNAVLQRLRTGGYNYTFEPGVYGLHTADEFWFDRREGFCEHIASAYAVLMRAMDVPARVVTGYQGGERNAVDGYWVVRQSDAHAWAEIWQAGQGWVRVDPTSAVAPARIGTFQRLQVPRNVLQQAVATLSPDALARVRAVWEAVNNGWNQWVLNYSQGRQLSLLRDIGFVSPSWEDLGYVLAALLAGASLVGAAWTLWDRGRQDPWLRLLQRARRRMQRAGLSVPEGCTPREMAAVLAQVPGGSGSAAHRWLLQLEAQRYAAPAQRAQSPDLSRLRQAFGQLDWPQGSAP